MKIRRFDSLAHALLTQKACEFVVLTLSLTVALYVGSRAANPTDWGIYSQTSQPILYSFLAAFMACLIFFVFTLYPLVTSVIVVLVRKAFKDATLPLVSAIVSVSYVLLWLAMTDFPTDIYWFWPAVSVMAAFIYFSSQAMYPRESEHPRE